MDAVEDIKQRLAIEDVIGEYIELKRSGRNFKGLSPFTSEKTPSLMVSPEKQIWHDFSSGKGGNMFSFVMEMEGLDFKGALELLARKAGIDLSQYQRGDGTRTQQKERLYAALELAAKFYQVHFSKNARVLDYVFKRRAYTKETALAFRLGYAPNTGTALCVFLKQKGFSDNEIKQAGLSTQRYGGAQDMFRGRLMVPLQDSTGRVIGFTARMLIDDPKAPKYINTPQTLLYDKSRHIFGLHLAKEAIRKNNFVVLVEGNLDVIASYQAGVGQTVATAGTALTEAHLKGLQRFTDDVRLSFDEDKAGVAATERAIPIAARVGVNLSIITLPERAKDPDELIKKDAKKWETAITQPIYVLDWLIDQYKDKLDLNSAVGKRQFSDVLLKTIRQLPDSVEQDHYLNKIAGLIGVGKEALETKLRRTAGPAARPRRRVEVPQITHQQADHVKIQNHLLAICLIRPDLREHLQPVTADMLVDEPAQAINAYLKNQPDFTGDIKTVPQLKKYNEFSTILGVIFEELYQDLETLELRYEAARLKARLISKYVNAQKQQLAAAMQGARSTEVAKLLMRAKELDQLLKDATSLPKTS